MKLPLQTKQIPPKMKSEAQFEPITCPQCGSTQWYESKATKYSYRIYCKACNRWNKTLNMLDFPKRIDTENQPSHCGKCKYFSETVFETETENGWASWYGDCLCDEAPYAQRISRYIGCEFGIIKDELRKDKPKTREKPFQEPYISEIGQTIIVLDPKERGN